MSARKFIVMLVLLALVSACAPATGTDVFEVGVESAPATDVNQTVKDELQPIVSAMLGGSINDQIAVVQYSHIACANVEGLGGPPPCPEGVSEGTEVEVFPTLGSEGSYITPENMELFLSNSIVKSLYAVYRVTPNPNLEPHIPEGEYAMLFERNMNDLPLPVILHVVEGKIVRMDFRFGISATEVLKEVPVENVLITPQDAQAWADAVR